MEINMNKQTKISDLIGVVMLSVYNKDNEEIIFTSETGRIWRMYHDQDCCESVMIEDIVGELSDLVGAPITMAEEVSNDLPEGWEEPKYIESYTWTFYKFATIKGYVTIRWFGESNGYYSETVNFVEMVNET
jgi:hypothetical protein